MELRLRAHIKGADTERLRVRSQRHDRARFFDPRACFSPQE
jgi:hypothetical protein